MLSYFGGGEFSTYAHPVMLFATGFMTTNIDGGIKALSRLQISKFYAEQIRKCGYAALRRIQKQVVNVSTHFPA